MIKSEVINVTTRIYRNRLGNKNIIKMSYSEVNTVVRHPLLCKKTPIWKTLTYISCSTRKPFVISSCKPG